MSDNTQFAGSSSDPDEQQAQHPKHRRDGVPVDGEPDLSEFGENPDTELAG